MTSVSRPEFLAALLASLLDSAEENVFVVDRDQLIVYVNQVGASSLGLAPEQIVGRPLGTHASAQEALARKEQAAQVFDSGVPIRAEAELPGRAGPRFYEYTVAPVHMDGQTAFVAFVGRDITERRLSDRNAAQLQLLTHRLAATLSQHEVADIVVGHAHEFLGAFASIAFFASPRTGALNLVAARNVPERMQRDLAVMDLQADMPVALAARERRAVWLESPDEVRAQFPAFAGQAPVPLDAVCALPFVFEGKLLGSIAFSFDRPTAFPPTTRRFLETLAAECAQALERARLMELQQRTGDQGAFLADASALLASSLEAEEVLKRLTRLAVPRFADWCAIDVPEGEGATRQVAVAHADPAKLELARELNERFPPEPGTSAPFIVISTGKPLLVPEITDQMLLEGTRNPEHLAFMRRLGMKSLMVLPISRPGKVYGAITVVWTESGRNYDFSDQQLLSDLAGRAALALENAELYRELKAAVHLRDDFLAMAGHELKTPLTALLLQLQAIERMTLRDASVQPFRDKILRAAMSGQRLDKLVTQLLDVSRITSGRLELNPEPLNLSEVVHDVVERFRESGQATPGQLVVTYDGAVNGVWDRLRLDQVVTNLVSNALKYGGTEPVEVNVRRDGGTAVLTVRDRGIGIAPEQQTRLFQRFERAAASRKYGGLGLGLWITRQILEAAGGSISVDSEQGRGASFVVRLPTADQ